MQSVLPVPYSAFTCRMSNRKNFQPVKNQLQRFVFFFLGGGALAPSGVKCKGFPYSIASVGPGADPGVQAVSLQVTVSHPRSGRPPLLSARPTVTFPATEHHRPLAGTKLYCLVSEAHRCEQPAQGCYSVLPRVGFEPATYWSQVQCSTRCATAPPSIRSNLRK